jgi:hypothetical protein
VNRPFAAALVFLLGIASAIHGAAAQTAPSAAASKAPGSAPAKKDAPKNIESVKRLQPSEAAAQLPGLPPEFVEKLNTRGCTIPQFDDGAGADAMTTQMTPSEPNTVAPTNVIEGEFAKKGQKDWAALCSNGKTSTIVIYWSKPTSCPASLARLDDAHYLKPAANAGKSKTLHYSRSIRPLGESDLDDRPGLTGLKPLKHQGIDDRFVGKSSAFFYCDAGKWRIFPAKTVNPEKQSQLKGVPKPENDSPRNK